MTEMNSRIHDNVRVPPDAVIGDFCLIGEPYRGMPEGTETTIGPGTIIRSHTVIYAGNRIGTGFQSGHGAFLRECNEIGDDVSVGTKSIVEHHVVIEDGVRIHSGAFVPEYSVLRKMCWIGPNVVLTNARYPASPSAKENLAGVIVEEHARIGANSTILPGITVGRGSLVGAGSVVTKDVPPGMVVVGNPARILCAVSDLPADYDVE